MASLLSVNVGLPKDVGVARAAPCTPASGSGRSTGRGWCAGSTSTATGRATSTGTAASSARCSSTRSSPTGTGRSTSAGTTSSSAQFGENFTVDGLGDDEVCIGDRYRIGEAEFEVTQPRVTCFRVGMRLGEPRMPALLVAHHRPGFYLRVIAEGPRPGRRRDRAHPGRPARAQRRRRSTRCSTCPARDIERLRAAVDIPALSPGWQQSFRELLDGSRARHRGRRAAPSAGAGAGPASAGCASPSSCRRPRRVTSVYLTADDGTLPPALAGQYLTLRAAGAGDPAPVRSYSLSSSPGADTLPDQRQARTARRRQHLRARPRCGPATGSTSPRRAASSCSTDGDRPGAARLRRHRRHARAGHAAPARRAASSTREVWWIHTTRRRRPSTPSPTRRTGCCDVPPERARAASSTPAADAEHRRRAGLRGRSRSPRSPVSTCRRTPPRTSAGRPGSWTTSRPRSPTSASRRTASTPSCSARCRRSTPGVIDTDRPAPHQPPGPPGHRAAGHLRPQRASPSRWSDRDPRHLLELAEACDVPTRWSCRTGVCHTCVTPLLSGAVDYAPDPLEPPGPDEVLLCCAQPDSDVVLDL